MAWHIKAHPDIKPPARASKRRSLPGGKVPQQGKVEVIGTPKSGKGGATPWKFV